MVESRILSKVELGSSEKDKILIIVMQNRLLKVEPVDSKQVIYDIANRQA